MQCVAFAAAVDYPDHPHGASYALVHGTRSDDDNAYVDANGCLTERVTKDGRDVTVPYDDVPESDITSIDGIRCTTALRTVIDAAPELDRTELEQMVQQCLDRRLFTCEEAMERVARPDMLTRLGARLVRQVVSTLGEAA